MSVFRYETKPSFKEVAARFVRADQRFRQARLDEVSVLARRFNSVIQRNAPKRKGNFAAGIKSSVYQNGNVIGFSTGIPQPLGKWLRPPGTAPHVITPRGSGYPLRFEVNGRIVYTYRVNHPGYRPGSDFVQDSYNEFKPELRTGLRRIGQRYAVEVTD